MTSSKRGDVVVGASYAIAWFGGVLTVELEPWGIVGLLVVLAGLGLGIREREREVRPV